MRSMLSVLLSGTYECTVVKLIVRTIRPFCKIAMRRYPQ